MSTELLTVTPETTVRDAMELLGRNHLSGAPVLAGGDLVGVVTATDLMTFAGALSGVPTEREAPEDDFDDPDLEREAEREDVPGVAYFSELWDDAGADVAERIATPETPEWNALDEHDVSEVMTRTPLATLRPDATVDAAADLMQRRRIHRVLVTDGGRLVGVVTALDVAKAAAEHKLDHKTYVFNNY